jgi:ribokinase
VLDGETIDIPGFDVGHAVDSTGSGDLFVAAWAWGDAIGMPIADTLRWAELYSALSVRVPTGAAGATPLAELIEEGARRGLPAPPARAA